MHLSIIIPVFNEEKTIVQVLQKVIAIKLPVTKKEIIIVDDGSTDRTSSFIKNLIKDKNNIKHITHKENMGKGAAVITGISKAAGEYLVIQDADLEYNVDDIAKLLQPVLAKKSHVVYGTRLKRLPNFSRDERTIRFFFHYMGNKTLSLFTSLLYFHWITDMECCYKLFPRKAFKDTVLHARGFELEPEITAKLLKKGYKIHEVSITTNPRGYSEGKKLNTIRDGAKAFKTLIKYRFTD